MKGKLLIITLLSIAIAISFGGIYLFAGAGQSKIFDSFEITNSQFRIRVIGYRELSPATLPGGRYVFQSASVGSDSWRDVLTVKVDEALPIPRNQIQFLNNYIAYIFFNNYYMVTMDGGNTWFIWNANTELQTEQLLNKHNLWPTIEEIELKADGTGWMKLSEFQKEKGKGPKLFTTDYGRHWIIKIE